MNFIDHTGHIFYQESYDKKPIGYEYEVNPYIFWVDDEYSGNLSIDNYYMKPIRIIFPASNPESISIDIEVDSKIFSLVGSNNLTIAGDNIIELNESNVHKQKLTNSDIRIVDSIGVGNGNTVLTNLYMVPFYVMCNSHETGSWQTNIMIHLTYGRLATRSNSSTTIEEWCPITVGGTFYNECEELIINGNNMGIDLPKEILKAVYQGSYWNDANNEVLYNEKIKEYLMNYMSIKGEIGNYESAINSLKWFGWGDKIEISKLLETDNIWMNQYIHDDFDINTGLLNSFSDFKNSIYVSLRLKQNNETEMNNLQNFNADFWGEGKPIYENLFEKEIVKHYDEGDIDFYRSYYDYMFDEMLLKLSCLKHYYQKYFLPVHMKIHSASTTWTVHSNDKKLIQRTSTKLIERPLIIESNKSNVEFVDASSYYYIYNHDPYYVDENFNRFERYVKEYGYTDRNLYYIDDLSITIPIKFHGSKTYDCAFVLEKDGKEIFSSKFSFADKTDKYVSFSICPKIINENFDINYWIDNKLALHILCNNKWYSKSFYIKVPEMQLNFGKLEYHYDHNLQKQLEKKTSDSVVFRSHMYLPSIVDANDINILDKIVHINEDYTSSEVSKQIDRLIDSYRQTLILPDNLKYYNRVFIYYIYDEIGNMFQFTGQNEPGQNINMELYDAFFNDDGEQKSSIRISTIFDSDFYLMHDEDYWYGVFITKDVVSNIIQIIDEFDKEIEISSNGSTYKMTFNRHGDEFLINRMRMIPANGDNKFLEDDVIVSYIDNIETPVMMHTNSKWNFKLMSLSKDSVPSTNIVSNSNVAIMSIESNNKLHKSGYYDVSIAYSIDGTISNVEEKRAKILIK